MIDLIKRLEEAREPTRELDAEIWCRINRPHYQLGTAIEWKRGRPKTPPNWMRAYGLFNGYVDPPKCPAYTSSVDAALSLVPEGWQRESLSEWDAPPEEAHKNERQTPWARATLCGTSVHRGRWGHSGGDGRVDGEAQSLALAICIAALKAKLADPPTPRPEAGEGVE